MSLDAAAAAGDSKDEQRAATRVDPAGKRGPTSIHTPVCRSDRWVWMMSVNSAFAGGTSEAGAPSGAVPRVRPRLIVHAKVLRPDELCQQLHLRAFGRHPTVSRR